MNRCPSMLAPTPTQGGCLSRLRLVGGRASSLQLEGILEWIKDGEIEITRRGNLQHRSLLPPTPLVLQKLQDLKLIGSPETDQLRNIMLSPMAGIDTKMVMDTSLWAKEWEKYLQDHRELKDLSAKFSIGFDGGETVSITHLLNDVLVSAIDRASVVIFLSDPVGVVVPVQEVIDVLQTIVFLYMNFTKAATTKPRLKEMVANYGIESVWHRVEQKLGKKFDRLSKLTDKNPSFSCLGVFHQNNDAYFAIGVAIPSSRLAAMELQKLKQIADRFGTGELRFTPWQSILIPFVHRSFVAESLKQITEMNLSVTDQPPITACAGLACNSSFTDTQTNAKELSQQTKARSITIHLSGCARLCAYSIPHHFLAIGVSPGVYALYHDQKKLTECTDRELLTVVANYQNLPKANLSATKI